MIINIYLNDEFIESACGDVVSIIEKYEDGGYIIAEVLIRDQTETDLIIKNAGCYKIRIRDGRDGTVRTIRFCTEEQAEKFIKERFSKRNGDSIIERRKYYA